MKTDFFLNFCSQLYNHLDSREVPGTELVFNKYVSNESQASGQKHGSEREHLFREMKVIGYG